MRHGIAGNKLNRKTSHRKATVRDIAKSVLIRQRICTTKAKAKEAKKLVDNLITMGKRDTLAEKRRAFAILCDHKLVSKLFSKIAPRFKERKGGYTRMVSYGYRRGDNAELSFLELTEKEKIIVSKPKLKKSSKKQIMDASADIKQDTKKPLNNVDKKEIKISEDEAIKKNKKGIVKPNADIKTKKNIIRGIKNIFRRKSSDK